MVNSGTGHDRCPSQVPGPSGAREPPCGGDLENKKTGFWFQEGARKFFNIRLTAGCGRPLGAGNRLPPAVALCYVFRAARHAAASYLTGLLMPTQPGKESVSAPTAAADLTREERKSSEDRKRSLSCAPRFPAASGKARPQSRRCQQSRSCCCAISGRGPGQSW